MSVSSRERGLNGKRVVCLGGTSGIGYAVAARSVNEGASVVVVSSGEEKVERAVSRMDGAVEGYAVDLTNEAKVRQLFIEIGEFDHLVFTAGDPLPPVTLQEMDVNAAHQSFNLRPLCWTAALYWFNESLQLASESSHRFGVLE